MEDGKVVFISLIGVGRGRKEGSKGYAKAHYHFDEINHIIDTSFFGSALYKVLTKQGHDVDKWLIFGTDKSSWSELLHLLADEYHNNMLELYDKVYDEEDKGISQELLNEWEKALQRFIPGIRLIMVDPLDYEIYIDHMVREIPDEPRRIVLDITHGLRHMPVIMAFSLMTLKHLKAISDIVVYYGAYDLKKNRKDDSEPTPVLRMDFINTLVSYAENLAIFNNSGYFPALLDGLGIPGTDKTYFWLEMNRQPRSALEKISGELTEKITQDNHEAIIAQYIKDDIDSLIGASLDRRMVERAMFFFDKKQYLKALVLLYEGLTVAIGRKYGFSDSLHYKTAENIGKYIDRNKHTVFQDDKQINTYYDLKHTRNAAVHGSRGKRKEVQRCVEHQDQFEILFKEGLGLYEYIVGDKLC